jgi:hypothetical protein
LSSTTGAACTTAINILQPHAFNLELQHFIPIYNKISLLCGQKCLEVERGVGDERRAQKRGHFTTRATVMN